MIAQACTLCGKQKVQAKGLCAACYARQRRQDGNRKLCAIDGCKNPAISKGYCSKCYQAVTKPPGKKIPSLQGEQWRHLEGYPGWEISSLGRVKSHRTRTERLIKPYLANGRWHIQSRRGAFAVHLAVLRTFSPIAGGEKTADVVFLDGDVKNPTLANLAWDTLETRRQRAADLAEKSEGQWGAAFAAYWRGDQRALDTFFAEAKLYALKVCHNRTWERSYHLNYDELAHAALVNVFFSIANARPGVVENPFGYLIKAIDSTNAKYFRHSRPLVCLDNDDGSTVLDSRMMASPSAELCAIAREIDAR